MSQLAAQRARDARIIKRFGGGQKATLRQTNTLASAGGQKNITVLDVNGLTAQGATLLSAKKDRLTGRVIKGATFTIAGVTGTYTVAAEADANAATGTITLSFTPGLASAAADLADLTFTTSAIDTTFYWMQGRHDEEDVKQAAAGERIHVLMWESGKPTPRQGDRLQAPDETKSYTIGRVRQVGSAGVSRYRVTTEAPN